MERLLALLHERSLEHILLGLNQSNREEYAQAFDSGAISDRSHDFMRSESALAARAIRR
ncbi:hypothetical protein [Methylocapsa palsarum]|uniref:hypothetical protein n=1 Tax=Methylocapsa palsarum TaxID=1612308 RepID=UPI001587999A|nr:hypothetical protein [Methylocapsa palsarum]